MSEAGEMGVVSGPDGRPRCWWCLGAPELLSYHDRIWGRPMTGDTELFEMMTLELFQSGLSWLTILRKRGAFAQAFAGWDLERIRAYDECDVERLLGDATIVRNRAKIEATIANAAATIALGDEPLTLGELLWSFAPDDLAAPKSGHDIAASTPESRTMSKELKRRGFRFVGPTTAYSVMQAAGIVDDHLVACDFRGP